jgi:hypothetical protein
MKVKHNLVLMRCRVEQALLLILLCGKEVLLKLGTTLLRFA